MKYEPITEAEQQASEIRRDMEWLEAPKMDIEAIVDKRIEQAVAYHKGSDTRLKCACLAAGTVVGTYSEYATQKIAKASNRSIASVENWAHAAWLYKECRTLNTQLARRLWRILPASHWWLAYDVHVKGYNAFFYLAKAGSHGWSGREMLREFDIDLKAGNAKLQIKRALIAFRGLADELWKQAAQLTEEQCEAIEKVIAVFGEVSQ